MQRNNEKIEIHIIANAALGPYMSGGDRIFIECARKWASKGHKINIYVWEEGFEICRRNRLEGVNYILWSAGKYKKFGFAVNYAMRTLIGIKYALKLAYSEANNAIIYSASDFWPDSLPAFLMKRKLIGAKWIAGFYLFAPNPFKGFRGMNKKWIGFPSLNEVLYYVHQRPIYWLVKKKADMIFVTCEDDRQVFIEKGRNLRDIVAIRGGVFAREAQEALRKQGELPDIEYDACFVGRFHPQKGVIELIKIWRYVCDVKTNVRLAIIGADSPEYREQVLNEIESLNLKNNIALLGFLDGEEKYNIFQKSRMILHPAIYDSGGMAACEGMAWGLPAVSFDLPALKTYYPKGMLKTPCFDLKKFSENIISLIDDEALYKKTREDAISWAKEWDWEKRADDILNSIKARFN